MTFAAPVPRPSPWLEALRVLILVAAALTVLAPFFSPYLLGGVDARWYAAMLADYIHQLRSGHLIVLAGQGQYDWAGGVHPFRSAPMYMMVAGVWDLVTFGHFSIPRLQHLTVLTSAVVGTLGCYRLGAYFLPTRRWDAVMIALCYLLTPGWLGIITNVEAYMSYMAFAVIPLILYGNARAIRERDVAGFRALGVGLALVWMCHPPIANICLWTSFVLQVANLASAEEFFFWDAFAGLIWFPILGAFYFAAMSEVPPMYDNRPLADLLQMTAFALFFLGFCRGVLLREGKRWFGPIVIACVLAGFIQLPWLAWFLAAAALAAVVQWSLSRWKATRGGAGSFEILFLSFLAAAALCERLIYPVRPGRNIRPVESFAQTTHDLKATFQLYDRSVGPKYGAAILLFFATALLLRWWMRDRTIRLVSAALITLLLFSQEVPGVSDFLVGYAPPYLASVSNLVFMLRLGPVILSVGVLSFVLIFAWVGRGPAWGRVTLRILLLGVVIGSVWQGSIFYGCNHNLLQQPGPSDISMRADNMPTFRYDYDLTLAPQTLTDGVDDPRLQLQLIDAKGHILTDVAELARVGEQHHLLARIPLIAHPWTPYSRDYLDFQQTLTLAPGQRVLVRLEFDPKQDYTGWFFMKAERSYREYHFPDSGLSQSFGSGVGRRHVLLLWNSSDRPDSYIIFFQRQAGSTIKAGDLFATMVVSEWDQGIEPVSLEGLIPLTVKVDAPKACFLETCRVFLPGYKATVDGVPVAVAMSPRKLVEVPVPAGTHHVVVTLTYTLVEKATLLVTGGGWLVLGLGAWSRRRRSVSR